MKKRNSSIPTNRKRPRGKKPNMYEKWQITRNGVKVDIRRKGQGVASLADLAMENIKEELGNGPRPIHSRD
ncbi:MAG: hypothetical protein Q8P86_02315 [bacterium]|nr:hypothetical protein [bacterium]